MGVFLDKPKTEKKIEIDHLKDGTMVGSCEMQGWRAEMEDARVVVCDRKFVSSKSVGLSYSFFAVLDGHAGDSVSAYASEHFIDELEVHLESVADFDPQTIVASLKATMISLDSRIRDLPPLANGAEKGGSTFAGCFFTDTHFYFVNLGDSRSMLISEGQVKFASSDHKPYLDDERRRIEAAGGRTLINRVNGSLAVSRALGDFEYKADLSIGPLEQMVSVEADVTVIERSDADDLVFIACDGIFDVITNELVAQYMLDSLRSETAAGSKDNEQLLRDSLTDLFDRCLADGSKDNMSVIAVVLPRLLEKSGAPLNANAATAAVANEDQQSNEDQNVEPIDRNDDDDDAADGNGDNEQLECPSL